MFSFLQMRTGCILHIKISTFIHLYNFLKKLLKFTIKSMEYIMNLLSPTKQITRHRRSINIQMNSTSDIMDKFFDFCRKMKILYNPYWRILKGDYSTIKIDGHEDFYYLPHRFSDFSFSPYLIIGDINNSNRFLILVTCRLENHVFAIFGIIVYIDLISNGSVCENIHPLDRMLLVADFIEDFPNRMNIFFSNQSIMVCLLNGQPNTYEIHMVVVDYEDKFVCVSIISDSKVFNISTKKGCNLILDRWVGFSSVPDTKGNFSVTLINLLSFEFVDDGVYFDITTFPDLHKFHEYIDNHSDEIYKNNDKLFHDSLYPHIICPRCEGVLAAVEYVFGSKGDTGGKNVCTRCKVRYSYVQNGWVCCKYVIDNGFISLCNNKISPTTECDAEHLSKYKFTKINMGKTVKYPNFERYSFCIECID